MPHPFLRQFCLFLPVCCAIFSISEMASAQNPLLDQDRKIKSRVLENGEGKFSEPEFGEGLGEKKTDRSADPTPLGPQVIEIVLLSHQNKATLSPKITHKGIDISAGLTAPSNVEEVVTPYLGQPISMLLLAELAKDIVNAWRKSDYPLVDVYFPEQNITQGKIQVVIREALLGKKAVEGAKYSNPDYLVQQVRIEPGDRINRRMVEADLDWLNENPIRRVDLIYQRGERDGTSDILLETREESPFTVYTGLANTGIPLTGENEFSFGANWANPFRTEQNIGYSHTTSLDWNSLEANSIFYQNFLPWRHELRVIGAYVTTDAAVAVTPGTLVGVNGENIQTSVEYRVPLPRPGWNRKLRQSIQAAWDYKKINTDLLFGGINVFANAVEVFQFRFEYEGIIKHKNGRTRANIGMVLSPGNVLSNNDDASFATARTGSTSDYTYFFGDIERSFELPEGFVLKLGGNGQITDDRLTSTEQILGGGYASVRGFDENLIRADSGLIGNIELIFPSVSVLNCPDKTGEDHWNLFTFYDAALLHISSPTAGEVSPSLQSAGLGFTCRIGKMAMARASYGWNLETHGVPATRVDDGKFHFGLTVKY